MRNHSSSLAKASQSENIATLLTAWYDRSRRDLPWRTASGQTADPYKIWLSEIMLQQTTVKTVKPYYENFLSKWPTLKTLANAEREDVLKAWAGLGYYTRARNLHHCAQIVVDDYNGHFPEDEDELLTLPGIGPYTAAAIAAIAFGKPATVVDGNVERVIARLFAVETPLPDAKAEIKSIAKSLTPTFRPGDYAQAMMDLGATICSPKRPSCLLCPLQMHCSAHANGLESTLPLRAPKGERPLRMGVAFLALREDGKVLLRERPQEGLLGGMIEVPSSDWTDTMPSEKALPQLAPVRADWWKVPGLVTHTFTHFRLELEIYRAVVPPDVSLNLWAKPKRCRWVPRTRVKEEALPSIMRKVVSHALHATPG